ncbi:hypothetical protein [Rhodopila sp.]|uniref:hypothetical protein n=1 Tax=Rhodopila sp. TaxID=2480087 RepID=UPI003D1138B4
MPQQALEIAKDFGPWCFLTVLIMLLAAGLIVLLMRWHKSERDEWRTDMKTIQDSHRQERKDWAEKQEKHAEKVTDKITEVLIQIGKKTR